GYARSPKADMPWRSASCATAGPTSRLPAPAAAAPASTPRARRRVTRISSRPLRQLGRLVFVPPPDGRESRIAVFRQRLRPAEAVPARGAHLTVGPLRHDVIIPQQHAVERARRRHQFVAVLGEDDAVDQGVDRRILDADDVARTGLVGGLRTPEAALLVAGRQRFAPGQMTMSKSHCRSRFSYCELSIVRTVTATPRRSSEG